MSVLLQISAVFADISSAILSAAPPLPPGPPVALATAQGLMFIYFFRQRFYFFATMLTFSPQLSFFRQTPSRFRQTPSLFATISCLF